MNKHAFRIAGLALALCAAGAAFGQARTPMGAEAAGNAAGTIPAWDGGLVKPPAGFTPGGHYPDPFKADKPLFTVTGANADQYKAQLSPGQMALLKKYPTWKMVVYPSRRTAAYPKAVYDETAANAGKAKLSDGGNGVVGVRGGIPFTQPKNGNEAIWNTVLRYRGDTYATNWAQAAVTREGTYTPVAFDYEYDFHYGNLSKPEKDREENKLANFVQATTAPARLAGQILLVHETVDQVKQPRSAWTYNPGQRRVRLAPQVAHDNPGTAADGLRTSDDFGMWNGSTERYDWKLVGKQELLVPYNSYRISGNEAKMAEVLKPGHVNPDLARYELHRVWVVEATLKPGMSHVYKKRVFYIDEDSWMVLVVDKYDARDELWRVAEQHSTVLYDIPMIFATVEVHHDLQSGRYIAMGLRNEEPKVLERIKRDKADFTPAGLRGIGTR
jgi:hypothetical protein